MKQQCKQPENIQEFHEKLGRIFHAEKERSSNRYGMNEKEKRITPPSASIPMII